VHAGEEIGGSWYLRGGGYNYLCAGIGLGRGGKVGFGAGSCAEDGHAASAAGAVVHPAPARTFWLCCLLGWVGGGGGVGVKTTLESLKLQLAGRLREKDLCRCVPSVQMCPIKEPHKGTSRVYRCKSHTSVAYRAQKLLSSQGAALQHCKLCAGVCGGGGGGYPSLPEARQSSEEAPLGVALPLPDVSNSASACRMGVAEPPWYFAELATRMTATLPCNFPTSF